jgi:hypothetical protein
MQRRALRRPFLYLLVLDMNMSWMHDTMRLPLTAAGGLF